MRHGWSYIYERDPVSSRFLELVDHFALDGISLAEPATGRVIKLSSVGEQISSSKEDILSESLNSPIVNFNLYLAPSENLFCSMAKLDNKVVREGYSLDGKTDEQSARIIKDLTQLFCRRAANHGAFGFVADKFAGLYGDFHWDDFFLGTITSPPEWPLVLGISPEFAKSRDIPDYLYSREIGENWILFRRNSEADWAGG
jgi:hypothetical protein